jgi:hypothetical protein
VIVHQVFNIEIRNLTVDHAPVTPDHDTVGAMGAAQNQCRQRIAGP